MKLAIVSPNGSLSQRPYSHRSAWAKMRADQLINQGHSVDLIYGPANKLVEADLGPYDRVLIYWGMEWSGFFNLFGGAIKDNAQILEVLLKNSDKLRSLDIPMPDIGALGKARLSGSDAYWKAVDWDSFTTKIPPNKNAVVQPQLPELVLGDSHALNWYQTGATVYRHDSKTLHGVTAAGLQGLNGYIDYSPEQLTLVWGNIDVRHHLMRQPDPATAMVELVKRYVDCIKETATKTSDNCKINVVEFMPIEDESRKLPKTGWHKGTPFYGTWTERHNLKEHGNALLEEACAKHGWTLLRYPAEFVDETGKLKFDYMERPSSVHISWEHSRFSRAVR